MANLENMRKRAKSLLRQHRIGDYPVAPRLRQAVPAFAGTTDRDILDTPFSLAEAQQVVAFEAGFASWAHAVEELSTMSEQKSPNQQEISTPQLRGAYPQIFVANVDDACTYYADKLGFTIEFRYGQPPFFAQISRGAARLNLRFVHQPFGDPEVRETEELLSAYISVDGVKNLFLEFKEREVDFFQSLKEQPWGATDFIVRDPDGNLLCFASLGAD